MEYIASRENPKIKYACKLAASAALRAEADAFFAEGPRLCAELAKSCRARAVYMTADAMARWPALAGAEVAAQISEPAAQKLAGVQAHQGVFAIFDTPTPAPARFATAKRLLALEKVQDPGNVGTLLRSAAAFGFDMVVLGPGCADPFAPKTLRASVGAAGRIPLWPVADLPAALTTLRGRGVTCLAAALYNSKPLSALQGGQPGGLCLVVGNEGQGLTDETVAACDLAVRIPMTDQVESLNAGVAGSVLLWHFRGID
ncbi:MAG: RNA methyltransferase [Gemmiger sp.]|nr:RNA methyltransferase [Gemmiger sp.]